MGGRRSKGSAYGVFALFIHVMSQINQLFQIDIHPAARIGEGVFIDHGTGIVIGETAVVGHNVSMLHMVTLGGSGKKHVDRHPKIGKSRGVKKRHPYPFSTCGISIHR